MTFILIRWPSLPPPHTHPFPSPSSVLSDKGPGYDYDPDYSGFEDDAQINGDSVFDLDAALLGEGGEGGEGVEGVEGDYSRLTSSLRATVSAPDPPTQDWSQFRMRRSSASSVMSSSLMRRLSQGAVDPILAHGVANPLFGRDAVGAGAEDDVALQQSVLLDRLNLSPRRPLRPSSSAPPPSSAAGGSSYMPVLPTGDVPADESVTDTLVPSSAAGFSYMPVVPTGDVVAVTIDDGAAAVTATLAPSSAAGSSYMPVVPTGDVPADALVAATVDGVVAAASATAADDEDNALGTTHDRDQKTEDLVALWHADAIRGGPKSHRRRSVSERSEEYGTVTTDDDRHNDENASPYDDIDPDPLVKLVVVVRDHRGFGMTIMNAGDGNFITSAQEGNVAAAALRAAKLNVADGLRIQRINGKDVWNMPDRVCLTAIARAPTGRIALHILPSNAQFKALMQTAATSPVSMVHHAPDSTRQPARPESFNDDGFGPEAELAPFGRAIAKKLGPELEPEPEPEDGYGTMGQSEDGYSTMNPDNATAMLLGDEFDNDIDSSAVDDLFKDADPTVDLLNNPIQPAAATIVAGSHQAGLHPPLSSFPEMQIKGLKPVPAGQGRYSKVMPLPGSSVNSVLKQKMLDRRSVIDQHMAASYGVVAEDEPGWGFDLPTDAIDDNGYRTTANIQYAVEVDEESQASYLGIGLDEHTDLVQGGYLAVTPDYVVQNSVTNFMKRAAEEGAADARYLGETEAWQRLQQHALVRQPWYRGSRSRSQAHAELLDQPEGTFVVRYSTSRPGHYACSFVEGHRVHNMLVMPSYAGKSHGSPGSTMYRFGTKSRLMFNTIPKLIAYYIGHPYEGTRRLRGTVEFEMQDGGFTAEIAKETIYAEIATFNKDGSDHLVDQRLGIAEARATYAPELAQMRMMGFTDDVKSLRALQKSGGEVMKAVVSDLGIETYRDWVRNNKVSGVKLPGGGRHSMKGHCTGFSET